MLTEAPSTLKDSLLPTSATPTSEAQTPLRRAPKQSWYEWAMNKYGAAATLASMSVQGAEGSLVVDNEGLKEFSGPAIALRALIGAIIFFGGTLGKFNLLRMFNTQDFKDSGTELETLVHGDAHVCKRLGNYYAPVQKSDFASVSSRIDTFCILIGRWAQAIGFGGLTILGLSNPLGKGFAEYIFSYNFQYINWLGHVAAHPVTRIIFCLLSAHINYKGFPGIWHYAFKPEIVNLPQAGKMLINRSYAEAMQRAQYPHLARLKLLRETMATAPWRVTPDFLEALPSMKVNERLPGFALDDLTITYGHRWGESIAALVGMVTSVFGFYNFYSLGPSIVDAIAWTFSNLPYEEDHTTAGKILGPLMGALLFYGMMVMSIGVAPDASRNLYRYMVGRERNMTTLSPGSFTWLQAKVSTLMLGAGLPVAFQAWFVGEKIYLWFVAAMAAVGMEMKPTFERMHAADSLSTDEKRVKDINQKIAMMNATSHFSTAAAPRLGASPLKALEAGLPDTSVAASLSAEMKAAEPVMAQIPAMEVRTLRKARHVALELLSNASERNPKRKAGALAIFDTQNRVFEPEGEDFDDNVSVISGISL